MYEYNPKFIDKEGENISGYFIDIPNFLYLESINAYKICYIYKIYTHDFSRPAYNEFT